MQTSVLKYLEDIVCKMPDKEAFFDLTSHITFSELRQKSLKLASKIAAQLDGKNHPILIYLEKDVSSIVSIFGVLYSGNFYTPTDVRFPEKKLSAIIKALSPSAVITDQKHLTKLNKSLGEFKTKVILIDNIDEQVITIDSKETLKQILDVDPVYVFFTSGSTGIPKGVIITNHNVIDYVDWASEVFKINESTIFGNQSPFYFDISTQDIFSTVKMGATMGIIPQSYFAFPIKAIEFIRDNNINFLYWVPSAFVNVANLSLLDDITLGNIHTIMFGGEVMPIKQLNYWKSHLPHLQMIANVYGPTEATVNCTYYIVDKNEKIDENLPLGFPCGNTGIILVDEDGNEIKKDQFGKKGELCVYGSSLSPGYWNDYEKTNEKFIENPFAPQLHQKMYKTGDLAFYSENGEIIFSGRKDFQIKHSGYRIELGEIETAALAKEDVEIVAVIYDNENKKIIMFYKGDSDEINMEKYMSASVPKYMIPSTYIKLRKFPLNDNGKIDRRKLTESYCEGNR